MINTPQTTLAANPWQSSVIWGNGVVNNGVTIKAPTSVSNPSSLNPSTTTPPKTTGQTTAPVFSDNMTKPILAPVVTAPVSTTPPVQPISTPTPVTAPTPTVAPATWVDRTAVDKVNQQTLLDSQKANWPQANENGAIISQQEITPKVIAGKTINFSDGDPTDNNNYLGTGMTKADALAQLSFDQLYELEQNAKQYIDERAGILGQTEYLAEAKKQMEYDAGQRDLQKQATDLQNQNAWIKSSQMIRQEQDNLDKLRQNTAFLGSGGRPVVSKGMLDSYARTLSEAQTTYNELVKVEENAATMRALWAEFDSKQYAENVRRLNKDLTDKVDSIILDAFNNAQSDIISGAIDTPQKLTALQQKYLGSIDSSVHAQTQRAVNDMKLLNDKFNKEYENVQAKIKDERQFSENKRQEDVKRADEFKKNASIVNDKLSAQTGFLTDANGAIMRNSDTWAAIRYNPLAGEKPIVENGLLFEPIFNPETGETTYKKTRLYTPASEQGSWSLKELADGTIVKMNDKTGEVSPYNTSEGDPNGNDPASNPTTLNISNPQTLNQIIDFCTTKRGTDSVQCGMLVNDYIMKVTGQNPSGANRFQDSLQSKITAIDNIGRAAWPVAGGLFAYPTNDPAGHTGIVTKVNPDGSIEVLEANVKGSAAGWPPKVSTYPASKYKSWAFSQAPAGQKEAEAGVNTAGDALKNIPWAKPTTSTNLSPLGNEALKSGTITGTPTQKGKLVDELAKAGVFDEGLGNSNYYLAGQPVKDWLKAVTEWYDKRQQARNIYNRMKDNGSLDWATWPIDKWLNKAVGLVGWNSSDYNNLNAILQKELSTYMNRISGATVSESEVNRLKDQIPNLSMNDSQFKDAMEQYNQSMKNGINYAQTQYWFDGINNMRTKLIGGGSSTPATSNTGGGRASSGRIK